MGALRVVERRKTARLATPLTAVSGRAGNMNVKQRDGTELILENT